MADGEGNVTVSADVMRDGRLLVSVAVGLPLGMIAGSWSGFALSLGVGAHRCHALGLMGRGAGAGLGCVPDVAPEVLLHRSQHSVGAAF
jgi:hypothetical protein